jgi:hypothetical protein
MPRPKKPTYAPGERIGDGWVVVRALEERNHLHRLQYELKCSGCNFTKIVSTASMYKHKSDGSLGCHVCSKKRRKEKANVSDFIKVTPNPHATKFYRKYLGNDYHTYEEIGFPMQLHKQFMNRR